MKRCEIAEKICKDGDEDMDHSDALLDCKVGQDGEAEFII